MSDENPKKKRVVWWVLAGVALCTYAFYLLGETIHGDYAILPLMVLVSPYIGAFLGAWLGLILGRFYNYYFVEPRKKPDGYLTRTIILFIPGLIPLAIAIFFLYLVFAI